MLSNWDDEFEWFIRVKEVFREGLQSPGRAVKVMTGRRLGNQRRLHGGGGISGTLTQAIWGHFYSITGALINRQIGGFS